MRGRTAAPTTGFHGERPDAATADEDFDDSHPPRPMAHEILINVTPQETRVAMLEQGVVQELHIERSSARGLVGNIYLGRVARVLPCMQSAFIEIGLERAAFLHIADIWEHRQNGHGGVERPIERILHEGQALLVQVDGFEGPLDLLPLAGAAAITPHAAATEPRGVQGGGGGFGGGGADGRF